MSPTARTTGQQAAPEGEARAGPVPHANDFALKIATANGTGSASANGLLMKTIFRMGIPVSGKNLFPSNIQGLPTWYEIRVSGEGHTARRAEFDLMVAMNPATYERDVREVRPGGWVLHDSSWPLPEEFQRNDVTFLGVPLARTCNERFEGARARILLKNIAYAGVLAALLDMDLAVIDTLLEETYGRKKALLDSNFAAVRIGHDYAQEHFDCPLPFRLEPKEATKGHILIDGNTAAGLGCVYAGATVAGWYPITPSTSLVDAFTDFCDELRKDPDTGKNRVAIVQAEDELAAIGMVVGASWMGARAFTATSGPGISLMSEFIGLAYYAEIPAVIFDIQRTGPSTGMPTRTQQGDLMTVAYASHGDTRHIALFPAHPGECFDMAVESFDLAERYQTPVFVVSDLDIGMNDWVVPEIRWDDAYRPDRGKVLGAEELEKIEKFHRYLDVDGDGIAARTLPGVHPKGAFFTRGSGHDRYGGYTEDADAYTDVVDRLDRKIAGSVARTPKPEVHARSTGPDGRIDDPAPIGLVTLGGCRAAVLEARARLAERGLEADALRIRAFPFAPEIGRFLESHEEVFVIEQNRDAQLRSLLALETEFPLTRMTSVRSYGGLPLSAKEVIEAVANAVEKGGAASTGEAEQVDSGDIAATGAPTAESRRRKRA
ncbi:MAG: 2-oxoacid:acceptor oxidoreductase subunit alpha [Gemmatimonadota bacterium]|nr:2-oxoacid:acceptor oxidoreductase subunit alpha [Gemmatimonadota bacterium]